MEKGVTLMEILIIVLVVAILSALALNYLGPAKEKALDKEAILNLKLIQTAQKIYKMDYAVYYPPSGSESDIATINSYLKLALPTGAQRAWDYIVWSTGCGRATRTSFGGGDGRSWYFTITDADREPDSGAGCP